MTKSWQKQQANGFSCTFLQRRHFKLLVCSLLIVSTTFSVGCKRNTERDIVNGTTQTNISAGNQSNESKMSTGEQYVNRLNTARPIAVMLDNHAGARPQAGLKDAEIVIEALAEGNITRYMAFFFGGMPDSVGPIRSARPYFLDRAMEYNAVYVHIGGSPQALSDIKRLHINDLDGLSSSNKVFFRKSHKKMPHNAYSTLAILRAEAEKRHYDLSAQTREWHFNAEDQAPVGDAVQTVNLPYRKNDGGYVVSYAYDANTQFFMRQINHKPHLDEIDQSPIGAKNVIIQVVPTKVVDDVGRLDLELVGSGDAFYLTDGVKIPLTWSKESRDSETIYKTQQGDLLTLNPGNTWIQIVPKNMAIQWE